MLAHPIGLDREALRLPVAGHGTSGDEALAERIERIRAAARSRQPAERHFSLQLFDLTRLKAGLGWRWAEQRGRAIAMIEAGLAREMTPADLHLDNGDTRYFAVRAASERREIERHAELLAADVTARLCGTIPGGAIIRVVTLPFDPDAKLAGIATVAALLARLEALGHGGELAAAAPRATPPTDLRARFRPVLQLRKRLVSAYRLTAQASDGQAGETLEGAFGEALDDWALLQAVGLLQGPGHSREPALIVPVHYPTLASRRSRDLYSQHCRQLPRRSSRQLIFELLDLPVELAQARTRELLGYLRPFCLALLVRMPKTTSEIGHLASSGVRGISLAASTIRDDALAVDTLTTLAGTARVAGMRSLLVMSPSRCTAERPIPPGSTMSAATR